MNTGNPVPAPARKSASGDYDMNIDPNKFISEERQRELIELADTGFGASAVRMAIRETAAAMLHRAIHQ